MFCVGNGVGTREGLREAPAKGEADGFTLVAGREVGPTGLTDGGTDIGADVGTRMDREGNVLLGGRLPHIGMIKA